MWRYLFIPLFLLSFFTKSAEAQFVSFGQDPSSFRWREIKTVDFQLIYPDFYEKNAQKMAFTFQELYRYAHEQGKDVFPISIILHAGGGISNGNVAMAPRKVELYTIPPHEASDSWIRHLCAHEFRHIEQIDMLNVGLTKRLYYIFGEIFPSVVLGLYVPTWFLEGDAVNFESSTLTIGRGHSPEFLNKMKALIVEKGVYPFPKTIHGSNIDFIPDKYLMGYFMVAKTRKSYGEAIWENALARSGKRPFGINPFATSLKIGMKIKRDSLWNSPSVKALFTNPEHQERLNYHQNPLRTLYLDNFTLLRAQWKQDIQQNTYSRFDSITTFDRYYTNYYYPQYADKGRIVAYKKGVAETGAFIFVKDGIETPITKTATLLDLQFCYRDSLLVWTEYIPHIRWEHAGRNTITTYDLRTKKYTRHRFKYNCYAPFPLLDGWGFVSVDKNNTSRIMYTDKDFIRTKTLYTAPDDELIIHPSAYGTQISAVSQTPEGLQLIQFDLSSGVRKNISGIKNYEIDAPIYNGKNLFYRSAATANNALNMQTIGGDKQQIASSPFGINYYSLGSDSTLYFSYYTSNGYKPGALKLNEIKGVPVVEKNFPLATVNSEQFDWQVPHYNDTTYSSRRYRKTSHLFHIHSWGPVVVDINSQKADVGVAVYSQNYLSTMFLSGGYGFTSGDNYGQWFVKASYQGEYPIFDLELLTGKYKYKYWNLDAQELDSPEIDTLRIHKDARLSSAELKIRIPFNFSRINNSRYLQPFVSYLIEGVHNTKVDKVYKYNSDNNTLTRVSPYNYSIKGAASFYQLLQYGILFSNQKHRASHEIWPQWAQSIELGYGHTPLNNINYGAEAWTNISAYFPGFARTHALYTYIGYQKMNNKNKNYSNQIVSPRGMKLSGYEMFGLRTTYLFPIAYTDWAVGSAYYLQNVNTGVFYDYGFEYQVLDNHYFSSYGVEVNTTNFFFRLPFAIEAGLRVGYETKHHAPFVNFLFSWNVAI